MKKILAILFAAIAMCVMMPMSVAKADFVEDTDDTFTILWLADTQDITYGGYGHAMQKMGKWIVEQQEALDIRYIVQTGDMVENGASPRHWANFDEMYSQFKDTIPYIGAAGNHEVKKNGYLEYLMRPEVLNMPRESVYMDGKCSFCTLEVNDCKFIIVAIGYGVEQESASWVSQVLEQHADYSAILLVHDYLTHDQRYGITGKWLYENVVVPNPNVRIVLSGHVSGTSARSDAIDDNGDGEPDRTVAQMMYDYQNSGDDNGQMRVMQFNTNDHSITVTTYSPITHKYYKDYWFGNQVTFTIENAF